MPISALLITLDGSADGGGSAAEKPEREVLRVLERESELTLGQTHGRRVPAVAETASLEAGREIVERLRATPGVLLVDVLSVHFEDAEFERPGE